MRERQDTDQQDDVKVAGNFVAAFPRREKELA